MTLELIAACTTWPCEFTATAETTSVGSMAWMSFARIAAWSVMLLTPATMSATEERLSSACT